MICRHRFKIRSYNCSKLLTVAKLSVVQGASVTVHICKGVKPQLPNFGPYTRISVLPRSRQPRVETDGD